MKNALGFLILLSFFAAATGCLEQPKTGKPEDGIVRVKNAKVGPGISLDTCEIPWDLNCVVATDIDSARYTFCINVTNDSSRAVTLNKVQLEIHPVAGGILLDTCNHNFIPVEIPAHTTKAVTVNFCLASPYQFHLNDTIIFSLYFGARPQISTLPVCQLGHHQE